MVIAACVRRLPRTDQVLFAVAPFDAAIDVMAS